jgi:DinB superfamily
MYVIAVPTHEALADFDKARAEWEQALGQAPDEALDYLKPGDDYALGGLQVHVNWVLVHYQRVLDALIAGGFAALAPLDSPGENDEVNKSAKAGLSADGRRKALATMASIHQSVLDAATPLSDERWSHKTAVVYGAGQDPYPTSVEDIIGWLSDHYREHVQQCAELIAAWRDKT